MDLETIKNTMFPNFRPCALESVWYVPSALYAKRSKIEGGESRQKASWNVIIIEKPRCTFSLTKCIFMHSNLLVYKKYAY